MILLMSAMAAPPCVTQPTTTEVLVEYVQSGVPEVGFRVLPDGRWQELDGVWSDGGRLDEPTLGLARSLVLATAGADLRVPSSVVHDATGCARWRLLSQEVLVPEGISVAALSALYVGLRGLAPG